MTRNGKQMAREITVTCKFSLALLFVLCSAPVTAELNLSQPTIDIHDYSRSEKVFVYHDGKSVLPGEITKIVAGVFKTGRAVPERAAGGSHFSNYSYMFKFEIHDDGSVTVWPVESSLQIGTYDLYVHTVHGTVTGVIDANLRDSIPARPPRQFEPTTFTYDLELSDYLYGQAVSIHLGPDKNRTYTWYLDGELHSSGPGLTSFQAWPDIGKHEISFFARNADGDITSAWKGTVLVSAEEAIRKTVRQGSRLKFSAPQGFSRVTWSLNGKPLSGEAKDGSRDAAREIKFNKKGVQTVTCHLQGAGDGNFRLVTWQINVK